MWERQVLCHPLCENDDKEDCDGEVGASKVTEDSINIAAQLPKLVRALTGVDMEQTMLAIAD